MKALESGVKEEFIRNMEKSCKEVVEPLAYQADKEQIFVSEQLRAVGHGGGMDAFLPGKADRKEGLYQYALAVSRLAAVCGSTAISYHVHMMCMRCIAACTEDGKRAELLDQMARGECLSAFALTEPQAGSDSGAIRTYAKRDGDDYILNGEKTYIMNITGAGVVITVAKLDAPDSRDLVVFAVPLPTQGAAVKPLELTGERGSGTGSITFTDCRVSADCVLGEPGKGYKVLKTILNFDRLGAAVLAASTAEAALDIVVDYTKKREQFGKPISSFQAVQFDVAEMAAQIRLNQSFIMQFLDDMAQDRESSLDASIIKLTATDMAADVTMRAIQLLGAVGYETRGKVERMHREVLSLRIGGGTSQIQKQIIAKSIYKNR